NINKVLYDPFFQYEDYVNSEKFHYIRLFAKSEQNRPKYRGFWPKSAKIDAKTPELSMELHKTFK
ncbi:MAG: hypothetical protein OXU68_03125, partial [Bacteroidota bacterium]|nr:hypothetical protein [Bacteroidota bacterium]